MKKLFILMLLPVFSIAAFAQMSKEQSANLDRSLLKASKGHLLMVAAKSGKVS